MTWDFNEQLRKGTRFERHVCGAVTDRFKTVFVPPELQREPFHMDCIWIERDPPHRSATVEITKDTRAAETGNIFIERLSVDNQNKLGKYIATWAEIVVHGFPQEGFAFVFRVKKMPIEEWLHRYDDREKVIPNDGYNTIGVPVPRSVAEREAIDTIKFPPLSDAA